MFIAIANCAFPAWLRSPAFWTATATVVIAIATVLYVIYTRGLWSATKKTAEAAKESADAAQTAANAAKVSADLDLAVHKPYIGIEKFCLAQPLEFLNVPTMRVSCLIKNFGTLPAEKVCVTIRASLDNKPMTLHDDASMGQARILYPNQVDEQRFTIPFDGEPGSRYNPSKQLRAEAEITYHAGDRRYVYRGTALFKNDNTFVIERAEVQELAKL